MEFTYPTGFLSTLPHSDLPDSVKRIIQAHWDRLPDFEKGKVRTNLSAWEAAGRKLSFTASVAVKMEHAA